MKKLFSFVLLLLILAGGVVILHFRGVISLPQAVLTPVEELYREHLAPLMPSDVPERENEASVPEDTETSNKALERSDRSADEAEGITAVKALQNGNSRSNVGLILSADNGEGAVVIREPGSDTIATLHLFGENGRQATITPNAQGLAATYEEKGLVISYRNYRSRSVDITLTTPEGEVTELRDHPHNVDMSLISSYRFIPRVLADEGLRLNTSLLLNSLSCSSGLIGSPTALISCPVLAVRLGGTLVSQVVDIPGCEAEELGECALRHYREYGSRKKLRGRVLNAVNNQTAEASLSLSNERGEEVDLISSGQDGSYQLTITGGQAVYTLNVLSTGLQETTLKIVESGPALRVSDAEGQTLLDQNVGSERDFTIPFDILLNPDGYFEGEVIDVLSGESLADAQLELIPFGLRDFTDESGTYVFFPVLEQAETDATLQVSANGYQSQSIDLTITAELEGNTFKVFRGADRFDGMVKLQPQEEQAATPTPSLGSQRFPISFDFQLSGMTHQGSGSLDLDLEAGNTGCQISLRGTATGVPEIPPAFQDQVPEGIEIPEVSGSFSGASQNCSGSMTSSGDFFLSGQLEGSVDFSVLDQRFEDQDNYPFTVTGKTSSSGVEGTLVIDEVGYIPFSS